MNEKSPALALIGLGFLQMLLSEEVSCDDVETILNDLPNPGEKIELSAEEIKTMLNFVLNLYLKEMIGKVGGKICFTRLRDL